MPGSLFPQSLWEQTTFFNSASYCGCLHCSRLCFSAFPRCAWLCSTWCSTCVSYSCTFCHFLISCCLLLVKYKLVTQCNFISDHFRFKMSGSLLPQPFCKQLYPQSLWKQLYLQRLWELTTFYNSATRLEALGRSFLAWSYKTPRFLHLKNFANLF